LGPQGDGKQEGGLGVGSGAGGIAAIIKKQTHYLNSIIQSSKLLYT